MNYLIILSGGIGSRMQDIEVPKQYYNVNNKAIIMYSIETVLENNNIDGFIVVAEKRWHDFIEERMNVKEDKFMGFVLPGKSRQMSIYNGLLFFEQKINDEDIIIIHDAARPNVTNELINKCIEKAKKYDGAMPVLPLKDTVYFSNSNDKVDYSIDRSKLFAGQAPEAFKYRKYLNSNKALSPDKILKINGSSEPAILGKLTVATVEGDERNYKITTKSDLEKFILEKENESICIRKY